MPTMFTEAHHPEVLAPLKTPSKSWSTYGRNSLASIRLSPGSNSLGVWYDDCNQEATQTVPVNIRLPHERTLGVGVLQLLRSDVFTL